jgi:putative transposase
VRINGSKEEKKLIDPPVTELPHGYRKWVNTSDKDDDLAEIRTSVNKGKPFGKGKWVDKMVAKYHLESTQKNPGRPKQG